MDITINYKEMKKTNPIIKKKNQTYIKLRNLLIFIGKIILMNMFSSMNSFLKMINIRKKIRQGQVKLKVKRKRWINMWLRGSVCSNLLMIAFSNKD